MINEDEDIRSDSIVMLGESLKDETPLLDVATAIESAVFHNVNEVQYKSKIRFLCANFKRNESVQKDVLSGRIQPYDVLQMHDEEFMTDEMKTKVEQMRVKMDKRKERAVFADGIESESYTCPERKEASPECKARKTKFIHLSDARDVRKAETWGNADVESKVLVVCMECKNEWVCSIL